MGSTGASSANHLHIDLVQTADESVYHLGDIMENVSDLKKLLLQYHYFLDSDLFKYKLHITSFFGDPDYLDSNGIWKFHPAYDVVPENRHVTKANFDIHWNRTANGVVLSTGFDKAYGNYINIAYKG
jgi:murein DD-endopeptidase MepM/ murein hydrolase activator NlpD